MQKMEMRDFRKGALRETARNSGKFPGFSKKNFSQFQDSSKLLLKTIFSPTMLFNFSVASLA